MRSTPSSPAGKTRSETPSTPPGATEIETRTTPIQEANSETSATPANHTNGEVPTPPTRETSLESPTTPTGDTPSEIPAAPDEETPTEIPAAPEAETPSEPATRPVEETGTDDSAPPDDTSPAPPDAGATSADVAEHRELNWTRMDHLDKELAARDHPYLQPRGTQREAEAVDAPLPDHRVELAENPDGRGEPPPEQLANFVGEVRPATLESGKNYYR